MSKREHSDTSNMFTVYKSNIAKKFTAFIFSFLVVCSATYIVPKPKPTDAFFASWGLIIKEYGLDGVAKFIAKRMLQMITRDTVNWINGGFQGGPGFVTNPERFALQISDATFNDFLDHASHCYTDPTTGERVCEPLEDLLCSPFRVNIQLALRSSYIGDVQYRCDLQDVVGNLQDFYDDFDNGGWAGWFTITQNRANMPFGAFWEAQNELDARIGTRQSTWQKKQDWGDGFLSWDVCSATRTRIDYDPVTLQEIRTEEKVSPNECPPYALETGTPGSIIQNQLVDVFGSNVAELEVADEINEIIGALLNQFTLKLFNSAQGLFGLKNKIDDNPGRVISQVNLDSVLEPEDPALANYCGSYREGFMPTATLEIGGDATFTTNRRDVTVQPGDVVTYSWCGANANQYASSYTVRTDLSSGCADNGTHVPWIAQNAYGEQSATVGAEQIGCAYEITYAARNTGTEDPLTGELTTESAESRIIVRVGTTTPPPVAGQCTISEVTPENLVAAASQIGDEIAGGVFVRGNIINIVSSNGSVDLTPVSPSGVAESIQQQVASQIGCTSTSNLTFVVFQVSNPDALPPEMLTQLGTERPNQILVVIDSVGN
ncbi:MAG: hypothetical protein COV34_03595 [Candidatus Zambryskibacteria bacterium CG10_big_fil_rev_8_21_14_0_10_42_12]|uniref:Uncharacterized protein n=1 Tax=Candidatus Zambryskibacteria bacterium CG10_big_fil_rev_8_21_14_0_10_42_12 TaxID=1975115 RepID=A0A2H0QSI7_9BACT|nr:MAG: hypothetical protein COV34_03595 [Candidatus Zambryskibacteria bacterium CG10_big_fil_rev_8_21_14_0_10_42_12]